MVILDYPASLLLLQMIPGRLARKRRKEIITTIMSLDFVIAGTKFAAPTSLHALVHRQRLHEVLTTGLQCPLTLVSAPAGYGKTSLLSEWVLTTRAHRSCTWVSLDA